MTELKNTPQLKSFKVLLIGDTCIDEYIVGSVDRLSPEAPVPIIKVLYKNLVPGMSSNVCLNLKALGIDPDFVTNKEHMIKSRFIDQRSGQHLLRVDDEPAISAWDGRTPNPINEYDCVIISDYNKGFLTYESIEKIIAQASGPVFIDTKKTDLSRFRGAYIKINELEYGNSTSLCDNMIVTMGGTGALLKTNGYEKLFSTTPADVVDVCGCGDTFLSALAYKFLMTDNIEDAIIFANRAAGLTVQHQGNYAPTLNEILHA